MNFLPSRPFDRLRLALNWSGVVILPGGLGGSVLIWRAQDRIERENEASQIANPAAPLPPLDSRKHVRTWKYTMARSACCWRRRMN